MQRDSITYCRKFLCSGGRIVMFCTIKVDATFCRACFIFFIAIVQCPGAKAVWKVGEKTGILHLYWLFSSAINCGPVIFSPRFCTLNHRDSIHVTRRSLGAASVTNFLVYSLLVYSM